MAASKPTCQWCGLEFPNITAKMVHVHEDHPETIGRGRTMSVGWSCLDVACGHVNAPVIHWCSKCGRPNDAVHDANQGRRFLVNRRRPDGTVATTPTDYATAHEVMRCTPTIMRVMPGHPDNATYDERRAEVWADGKRVAWLEVADVTATPRYQPN